MGEGSEWGRALANIFFSLGTSTERPIHGSSHSSSHHSRDDDDDDSYYESSSSDDDDDDYRGSANDD